jgi:predicted CXXCH cytochrome family protein
MQWQPKPIIFFLAIVLLYATGMLIESCQDKSLPFSLPGAAPTFSGSTSCKSCHASQYNDWLKSDHYQAMQPATDSTVLGDFNNATFTADGVINTFSKKDGKFFINTQGEDGQNRDYEVLYTFGFFPLQQYLVAFPGGRLQATRASWNSRDKKWFHQYAHQNIAPNDWLHWTGNGQNWNTMCASCHSTDLQKNYDSTTDSYKTTWKEVNVTCENCHGPGSAHIELMQSDDYKHREGIKNAGLIYGRDTTPQIQLNACAPCHARKSDVALNFIHSDEILDDLIPQIISTENYFADGQIRDEDYEYSSFTQSKMFHNGVQCSNCHNPHSGKLLKTENDLCLQCHKPSYDTPEHHFHIADTEQSLCINCHMTQKTFMGIDHRRDHSFRVPRPDQSVTYGTPNACTGCHSDKSNEWAAAAIIKWYGPDRKYHFSDDLAPGSLLDAESEAHLRHLLADTSQPEIARATAIFYLSNIQSTSSAQTLQLGMKDKQSLVRYHSVRAMENFPVEVWIEAAAPLLNDKVRAVRIAAADLFHRLPTGSIPTSIQEAYRKADVENQHFLMQQTDFAVGNVMMADYEMQAGKYVSAIDYYQKGLKKDNQMNYARFNLSAAYNTIGKNEEALNTLQTATFIDPNNERIYYNLGLLYFELKNEPLALDNFKKAYQLNSSNPGLYYNYGLLLQQQGKLKEAEQTLLKGNGLHPEASNLNYALAYFYISQKMPQKAIPFGMALYALDPQNPEYQELYSNLGIPSAHKGK